MEKCPKCGSDIPITSRTCPMCGYVTSNGVTYPTEFDIEYNRFGDLTKKVCELGLPTFLQMFNHFSVILYPIIALIFFVTGAIAGSTFLWILSAIFLMLFFIALTRKLRNKDKLTIQKNDFLKIEGEFEDLKSHALMMYGGNRDTRKAIEEKIIRFEEFADKYKGAMNSKGLQGLIAVIITATISLLLGVSICHSMSQDSNAPAANVTTEGAETANATSVTDKYLEAKERSIDEGESARIEIVHTLVGNGRMSEAKEFFHSHCMGNMSDYKIAEEIVKSLIKIDYEEAASFIESCDAMRYPSDKMRLYRIIQ